MEAKMTCIIVDDEPLAQKGMQRFIEEVPFLELKAVCDDALQAMRAMDTYSVDLMFLDIKMPKILGLDFLKSLDMHPIVIITTAYPDFALASYEQNVLDYLVKPISLQRFIKAVNKAKDYFSLKHSSATPKILNDYCFIKCENRYEKIYYNDLIYVEGMQNYVVLYTGNKKLISYLTLKNMQEHLPAELFIQVNKSFIISVAKIEKIVANIVYIGAHSFTMGRPYREDVISRILSDKLVLRNKKNPPFKAD